MLYVSSKQIQTDMKIHCKKRLSISPVPSRDVINQTLPVRENLDYSQPGRVWFVTSRLGKEKLVTFFYIVAPKYSIEVFSKYVILQIRWIRPLYEASVWKRRIQPQEKCKCL